jgi:excisionase family DNA binding protein
MLHHTYDANAPSKHQYPRRISIPPKATELSPCKPPPKRQPAASTPSPAPDKRAAQARANKAGAISREQAAVYWGVGYSTLEKKAARGEGPFCFRTGSLVRYPVAELEAWKRANDARQPSNQEGEPP